MATKYKVMCSGSEHPDKIFKKLMTAKVTAAHMTDSSKPGARCCVFHVPSTKSYGCCRHDKDGQTRCSPKNRAT